MFIYFLCTYFIFHFNCKWWKNINFDFLGNSHTCRFHWEKLIAICFSSLAEKVLELWPFKICKKFYFWRIMSRVNKEYFSTNDRHLEESLRIILQLLCRSTNFILFTIYIRGKIQRLTFFDLWTFKCNLMHQLNFLLSNLDLVYESTFNNSNNFGRI